jgi:aromatic ring-opening dioxygenase catalytic subunit (LigB family)
MLYDYRGFPASTYEVQWQAPGSSALAIEIQATLQEAGIPAALNPERGFDHGTFVPLSLSYPAPTIPCLQLSLVRGLDPAQHLQLGRSLTTLRDRGVLIVGSGMSYHNMQGFMQSMRGGPGPVEESRAFDNWLGESMLLEASRREAQLVEWEKAPRARECHPREEHLLPLHVVAGAAGTDAATLPYRDAVMGAHVSAVHFG